MGENDNKNNNNKVQQERGEARAPANLTQQPTKEQEGHDGAMSGSGAGR